jgi:hypothetical protein
MNRILDLEKGITDNEIERDNEYQTEADRKMGIETPREPSLASRDAVVQVDNSSNFVFSSFHDLNLFIILDLENKLIKARRKLYDGKGLPQEAKGWNIEDTLELQIHLKKYRVYL